MKKVLGTAGLLVILLTSFYVNSQTKIMTFNIRYDNPDDGKNSWSKRKEEVCQLIQYYHPDVVGIQEALPNQVQFINSTLEDYDYIGFSRDGVGSDSESVPIFYNTVKYELLDKKVFWLSETPNQVSKGWDAALNRIGTYGAFKNKLTLETIHVINVHFDHRGKISRKKSAQLILNKIQDLQLKDKTVIVLGDFNAQPEEASISILKSKLEDAFQISKTPAYGPIGTFNGFNNQIIPTLRIDYVFTKNVEVSSYRCINDKRNDALCISDHLPVLIELAKK